MALERKSKSLHSKPLEKVRDTVPLAEVLKEEMVRVNLNVPETTRTQWKLAAIERKMPLADLIVQAMSAHLSK